MTAERDALADALPCPWCGSNKITTREWSTYSWLLIGCCRELEVGKVDRAKPHDDPVNVAPAVVQWNRRAALAAPAPGEPLGDHYCPVCKLHHADARGRCRCQGDKPAQGEPPAPDDACDADDGGGICADCGEFFAIPDGLDPTPICNLCAQVQAAALRAENEQQAREIARVKLQLTSEITSALAERDALRLANIDAANLLAECSDMSVDIEKYRNEIAELKSELDAAQRAGVTTANYWMERAEQAEDQRERTRDVWASRAERAEAERDALRECVKAADVLRYCPSGSAYDDARHSYDAARAKVQP